MGKISKDDVKEKLLHSDGFCVFVYLDDGQFLYDTELKDGCIGVLSTDVFSMLEGIGGDEEYDILSMQLEKASKPAVIRPEYADNEVPTSENKISENRLRSEMVIIYVNDLEKAKKYCNQKDMEQVLISELSEICGCDVQTCFNQNGDIDIREEFSFDSLDIVVLWGNVEEKIGVEVPDNVVNTIFSTKKEFRTIRWIASFLVNQIELASCRC